MHSQHFLKIQSNHKKDCMESQYFEKKTGESDEHQLNSLTNCESSLQTKTVPETYSG